MFRLDIALIACVVALLPVCAYWPWVGVLVFYWLGYMNPHRLVGGVAYALPLSKVVAIATLLGVLCTSARYRLPRRVEVYLLGALWLTFLASTLFTAIEPDRAWDKFLETSKILLMTGVVMMLFQERGKLRALLLVIALSIGVFGISGGLWAYATGMQDKLFGPSHSSLDDNNALGFAFTIVLPLLAWLRREEESALLRWVLLLAFGLTIVALFATYSRGTFIGFCIVFPLIVWQVRTRDLALIATGLGALLAIHFAPQQWVERMETITPTVYRVDRSGSERMKSWYVAYRLGLDHPLLGVGFCPFSPAVYQRYLPGYSDAHDAHNHFLQVLAEHGVTGLVLFTALLVAVLVRLWHLTRSTRGDPAREWIADCAPMIGIALIAYVVGGVFINLPYFDLYYVLVAVTVLLQEMAASSNGSACVPLAEPAIATVLRRWR